MLGTARRELAITCTDNVPCNLLSLVEIGILHCKLVKVFYIEFKLKLCGYMGESICFVL